MVRFLHTADWQLGLKLTFIAGDRGALARGERFEAVRRLATLAKEREVMAVLVAGDVFDDNGVGRETLQRARDVLALFKPIPVLLLPGNHDAAGPDSVLRRLDAGAHVHALTDRAPWDGVRGMRVYPCPLERRHERDDPTRHLPARTAEEPIRVAIAHGGLLDFDEAESTVHRIDWRAILDKGFDYLALGDWHGTLRWGPRVWYSGTPEPTRFKEKRPGHALIVEIDAAGATPRVEEVVVARTRWIERRESLEDAASLTALSRWFEGLENKSLTLVSLSLAGLLSMADRAALEEILETYRDSLMLLRVDDQELHDRPTDEDLDRLGGEGYVGSAIAHLRGSDATREAEDALRLLYQFVMEDERASRAEQG
jgi:DNA repair exonuclease SbcCD nuclease subunit